MPTTDEIKKVLINLKPSSLGEEFDHLFFNRVAKENVLPNIVSKKSNIIKSVAPIYEGKYFNIIYITYFYNAVNIKLDTMTDLIYEYINARRELRINKNIIRSMITSVVNETIVDVVSLFKISEENKLLLRRPGFIKNIDGNFTYLDIAIEIDKSVSDLESAINSIALFYKNNGNVSMSELR